MPSQINLRQLGEKLHALLLAGASLTATSEIAEVFLPAITNSLRREFWSVSDPHLLDSAAEDALIDYFANPGRYEPGRAGLFTYLRLRARSRLLEVLQRRSEQEGKKVVEVEGAETVNRVEAQESANPEEALVEHEANARIIRQLREILPNSTDLKLVELMMEGVRETGRFAEELGLSDYLPEEQAIIVKRHKDRVKKTVQRKYRRGSKP